MYKIQLVLFLLLLSCNQSVQRLTEPPMQAKNIILLVGDGMGLAQLSSVYYFDGSPRSFSRFKCIGLHENTPVGAKITDSAAGATAFSIGMKSYNGAIGVDQDTTAHETILEWAAKQGKRTGVIATSTITHATPASFYAHVKSRNLHEEIALDFMSAPVHFTAGGGYQYFNTREDGRNLLREMRDNGVRVDTMSLDPKPDPEQRYLCLLGPDSLHSIRGGRGDFLPDATKAGLNYLSEDQEGFFLVVEGSQIDWGGHDNNAAYIISEMADFDRAVDAALDFAEKDGQTLVVVTADHETGGYSLSAPVVFGRTDYNNIQPTFSTGGHSASLIPVFAYGPGAERFMGVYSNQEIYHKMMAAFRKQGSMR